jgi:hypothetical protein
MSRFVLIFVAVPLLLPSLALAKRVAPAKVQPVIHQGVRYIAPNDDGRRAYIEGWDVPTNKKIPSCCAATSSNEDFIANWIDMK